MTICAFCAGLGIVGVERAGDSAPGARMAVAAYIWAVGAAWSWTADRLGRRSELLRMTLGQILRRLRDPEFQLYGVAKTMERGSRLLLLAGFLYLIFPWT